MGQISAQGLPPASLARCVFEISCSVAQEIKEAQMKGGGCLNRVNVEKPGGSDIIISKRIVMIRVKQWPGSQWP